MPRFFLYPINLNPARLVGAGSFWILCLKIQCNSTEAVSLCDLVSPLRKGSRSASLDFSQKVSVLGWVSFKASVRTEGFTKPLQKATNNDNLRIIFVVQQLCHVIWFLQCPKGLERFSYTSLTRRQFQGVFL